MVCRWRLWIGDTLCLGTNTIIVTADWLLSDLINVIELKVAYHCNIWVPRREVPKPSVSAWMLIFQSVFWKLTSLLHVLTIKQDTIRKINGIQSFKLQIKLLMLKPSRDDEKIAEFRKNTCSWPIEILKFFLSLLMFSL